jgi:hypothetical protein
MLTTYPGVCAVWSLKIQSLTLCSPYAVRRDICQEITLLTFFLPDRYIIAHIVVVNSVQNAHESIGVVPVLGQVILQMHMSGICTQSPREQ